MRDIAKRAPERQEQEAARWIITDLAPRIDGLQQRWESDDSQTEPGSSLAGDDKHSRPFHVSHAVWLSIGHAIDNLIALRTLTLQGEGNALTVVTRPYAAYPLIRAALENASAGLWVLGGSGRDERLTRRFRLLLTDAGNRDKAIGLADPSAPSVKAKQLDAIRPLITARGLVESDCAVFVGHREIVRGAARVMRTPEDEHEAIWRILSGLTHGDMWATHTITDRDDVRVHASDGDVYTVRTTSSVSNVANLTSIALSTTSNALGLFDRRRASPYGGAPGR